MPADRTRRRPSPAECARLPSGGGAPRPKSLHTQRSLGTGECLVSAAPVLVSTILGSCVAVTLFSPRRRIGAICHAFLPSRDFDGPGLPERAMPCRYVDEAIVQMLDRMRELDVTPGELEIQLIGGARGMAQPDGQPLPVGLGDQNVRTARDTLAALGLEAHRVNVGGAFGRKLLFLTSTGEAWVKRLNHQNRDSAATSRAPRTRER